MLTPMWQFEAALEINYKENLNCGKSTKFRDYCCRECINVRQIIVFCMWFCVYMSAMDVDNPTKSTKLTIIDCIS